MDDEECAAQAANQRASESILRGPTRLRGIGLGGDRPALVSICRASSERHVAVFDWVAWGSRSS